MDDQAGGPDGTLPEGVTPRWRVLARHQQLVGLVVLAGAFVYGSSSIESGLRAHNQPSSTHQVTVTGSATQQVTADTFEWDASVSSTQPSTSAALTQIEAWTTQIRTALINSGARSSEITFGTLQVQPNVQPAGGVTTFTETETITVQSKRVPIIAGVTVVADQLLAANVPFIAQDPKYTFSGLKKLRPVLTAEATADARNRAKAAVGRNGRIGKSISIDVGQFSVDAPGGVNVGSGDFYTGGLQQVVSVPVTATYAT